MANISLKGEDILLEGGKSYFVIDALYLNDIKEKLPILDKFNVEQDIRKKAFPFPNTETPLASLSIPAGSSEIFRLGLSKIKTGKNDKDPSTSFSSDTGLIVFIEKSRLLDFSRDFDYNQLVEAVVGPINISYWTEIENKFGFLNCALILSPGMNKGFDFDGSGLYRIEI